MKPIVFNLTYSNEWGNYCYLYQYNSPAYLDEIEKFALSGQTLEEKSTDKQKRFAILAN